MEAIGLYLIKSTIVSGLLYVMYHAFLRRESFFSLNRFYLLISFIFSYLFPFVKVNINVTDNNELPIITSLQDSFNEFTFTEEFTILENTQNVVNNTHHYWWLLIPVCITLIFLYRFIKHIYQLHKTINANEKINHKQYTLVLFNQHYTFSFFRYIFISQSIWNSSNGKRIFEHELSHIRHKHSLDRLFIEIMQIVFWVNPFIYLYRKALEEVHEYQADREATQKSNSVGEYFQLVVQQSVQGNYSPLMSPFSYKLIKKRILMSTHKSHPLKRFLLIAPIAMALLIVAISGTSISKTNHSILASIQNELKWPKSNEEMKNFHNPSSTNHSASFEILINKNGQLLMDNRPAKINEVQPAVLQFLLSKSNFEKNTCDGVVRLQRDVSTSEEDANGLLNEVSQAYTEAKEIVAKKTYNKVYSDCNTAEQTMLNEMYQQRIAIVSPKNMNGVDIEEASSAKFIAPIRNQDLTKVSSRFGMRMHPIKKVKMMHNGIDYVAPLNTGVLAIADGTVRNIKLNPEEGKGYGKFLIIDHENGFSSLYAQLNAYNVKEGQTVKQGDVIAYLGSTGLSTGPHLHFELKKDGEYVNPEEYFK